MKSWSWLLLKKKASISFSFTNALIQSDRKGASSMRGGGGAMIFSFDKSTSLEGGSEKKP